MSNGFLLISLDFELFWGVFEKKTLVSYGDSIEKVHDVIPRLLVLADKYDINLTFSTVGFIFNKDKASLLKHIPESKPSYTNNKINPYEDHLTKVGNSFNDDPNHYGYDLIQQIKANKSHEIGTHTYSHFFALEDGQTIEQFDADIKMAVEIANENNILLKSIVFPRNQVNVEYFPKLIENGIKTFRGTENSWLYYARPSRMQKELKIIKRIRRALRFLDAYLNISGHNTYKINLELHILGLWNLPSSRLFRPYNPRFPFFEPLKISRIKKSMTYAAKNRELFHLWWHPHNLSANMEENFKSIEEIFQHYSILRSKYDFKSITMAGLADHLNIEFDK